MVYIIRKIGTVLDVPRTFLLTTVSIEENIQVIAQAFMEARTKAVLLVN